MNQSANLSGVLASALTTFLVALVSFLYLQGLGETDKWLSASQESVFTQHQYWRAWTTVWVHADGGHLIANSLLLFILGSFMAGHFGILVFPMLALLLGGVINLITLSVYPPQMTLVGASGVVFWLGGAWLVLYFLIDTRRSIYGRAIRALGVGLALFMPSQAFDPSVSYLTHLLGFVVGVFSGILIYLAQRTKIKSFEVHEQIIEPSEPLEMAQI